MKKNIKIHFKLLLVIGIIAMAPVSGGKFGLSTVKAAAIYTAHNADGTTTAYEPDYEHINDSSNITISESGKVYRLVGNVGIITVETDISTTLILENVIGISASGTGIDSRAPLQLKAGSDVTLVLLDGTVNEFTCNGVATPSNVAQAGINVLESASLIVKGQEYNSGVLNATGGAYAAGIGGGPNQSSGNITMEGGIVKAVARELGGKIGGGNGAGIGGGGGHTAIGGSNGGIITICANADVSAISEGNGAGIGSGGSINKNSGFGGVINIYGNAKVYAESGSLGAGIGSGGSENGSAGDSGMITILGNPIISAKGNGTGIGSGVNGSGIAGALGTITINSGNIYALNTNGAKNGISYGGDTVGMVSATDNYEGRQLEFSAKGSKSSYLYTATTDENKSIHLWLPLGNQLVICRDSVTGDIIGAEIIALPAYIPTAIDFPQIASYAHLNAAAEEVTWDGISPLAAKEYEYTNNIGSIKLQAFIQGSDTAIDNIEYVIESIPANLPYSYDFYDVDKLTELVNKAYPDRYILISPTFNIDYIEAAPSENIAKIYYTRIEDKFVEVEMRLGGINSSILLNYFIPVKQGETVALGSNQAPNLARIGYELSLSESIMSATEGVGGDKIILVYNDIRFETNIRNNIDESIISEKTVPGSRAILYPPHKDGYRLSGYSIDNGNIVNTIPRGFSGYSVSSATDIIFYYNAVQYGGNITGGIGNISGNTGNIAGNANTVVIEGENEVPLGSVNSFVDVSRSDWFYNSVNAVYLNSWMYGTSTQPMLFEPNMNTSRAMFVTILHNIAGKPLGAAKTPFADVAQNMWYSDAVSWAFENGIVTGTGKNTFSPNTPVSREDIATILMRYAAYANISLPQVRQGNLFNDRGNISGYAQAAADILYRAQVISGRTGNIFDPKAPATRAETAAMIHQFMIAAKRQ